MTDPTDATPIDHLPTGEPPRAPNDGARMLLALGSLRATAKRLRVSPSTVVRWSQGSPPGAEHRGALAKLGIPREAWSRAARTAQDPPAPATPADGAPGGADRFTRRRVTLAEVEALLADVRVRRAEAGEQLAGRDYSVLVATEARLLAQKAKIIDSEKDDEIALSKSPRWARIKTVLAKMLLARDRTLAAEVAELLEREGLG